MGSWKGRGNQYIEFIRDLYCKLLTNDNQLPAIPLEAITGIKHRPQRWEARVLPLCHLGPSQPDHVQVEFCNTFQGKPGFVHTSLRQIVNNQYPCRLVYNQSISDLNILKLEMLATRATWKGWLAVSDSCKPVIPGKSYAEVLKTDSELQYMHSCAKNGMAIQEGRSLGELAGWGYLAPTKKSNISSDSPAHQNTDRVNTKAAPDELQTPVALFNRFSPLYEVADLNEICISDTLNDFDGTFSDIEGNLGILELNSENAVSQIMMILKNYC